MERRWQVVPSLFGRKVVIDGGQYHPMANQRAVADEDTALVLEVAAAVDENVFANMGIAAKIGVKRRQQAKTLVNFLPGQLGENRPYFLWLMVAVI